MRMADEGDIVVDIKKRAPSVVVKILPPAFNDLELAPVGDRKVATEKFLASGERLGGIGCRPGKNTAGNPKNQVRVRREARVDVAFGGKRHSGKIGRKIKKVKDDLEVEMGSPAAVFCSVADSGKLLRTEIRWPICNFLRDSLERWP